MSVATASGIALDVTYNANGNVINDAKNIYGESLYDGSAPDMHPDYTSYTFRDVFTTGLLYCQGMAIHKGYLFQFRASENASHGFNSYRYPAGELISSEVMGTFAHADSVTFGKSRYTPTDSFPLCYITSDKTPCEIYVTRLTPSSAMHIKTIVFPMSAGYYGAAAYDLDNNIMYILAYSEDSATVNSGTNNVIISKWDMSALTDNGNGTYTPAFISQFERDFIYCMQGLEYHDGMIWVVSGGTNTKQYIYALNPNNGDIIHTINVPTNTETEAIAFIDDLNCVVSRQGGLYQLCTFAQLEEGN